MNSVAQTFDLAVKYHQGGDLQQAELLYRQILQLDPRHADSLHLLGVIACQEGRGDAGVAYIRESLRLKPDVAAAHYNLGILLQRQGRLEEAEASYREALRLRPDHAQGYADLGNVLSEQGKLEEAEASYRQAVRVKPDYAEAHNNLGNALLEQGKFTEAEASYRQALRLRPNLAEAHNNLGNAIKEMEGAEPAEASYREAVRYKPDYAEAHNNLGNVLLEQGKLEEAKASYREAVHHKPDYAEAHNNLGNAIKATDGAAHAEASYREAVRCKPDFAEALNNLGGALLEQGKLEEAKASFHEALRVKPDHAEAHNNLGNALLEQGKVEEARASIFEALRIKPDFAEAHYNLGNALLAQGELRAAEQCFREALRLKPGYGEAYNNLGIALKNQGKLDEAITNYQQAVVRRPDLAFVHSNLIFNMHYHPDYDAAALLAECRRWNEQHAQPLQKSILPHANVRDPERKLRVGYVSPDFRDHVVSNYVVPLLANRDRERFEVYCYADVARPDDVTKQIRGHADIWRGTLGLPHEQVAGMVRGDQIDILVDLALHTADNRLLVFARKPAPVQVSWLGYPGTTGLSAIDYRLTDPYLDPPGVNDADYSEESIRLPDTSGCYDPLCPQTEVNELPAIQDGYVTFGCLNNFCKVNDGNLSMWAKVLQAVPRSRLLLRAPRGEARDHVLAKFQQEGIAKSRVEFGDRQPAKSQYFQTYHGIDLCLDTSPYNGQTTSLDALWMGVPIITLVGRTVVGRAGWSLLCNLDLKELAAHTPEEYVSIAAKLATDLPRLQHLRATLRARMLASPLMDGRRFARHMEDAYRQMWRQWCRTGL